MYTVKEDFISKAGEIYFKGEILRPEQLYNLSFIEKQECLSYSVDN